MKKAKQSGTPFVDRTQAVAITDDEIAGAVLEGIPNMASGSHVLEFAMAERKAKPGEPREQVEEAGCSHSHHIRSGQDMPIIRDPEKSCWHEQQD